MVNRIPDYLKLYTDEIPALPEPESSFPELTRLAAIFPTVTGLNFSVVESPPDDQLLFPWDDNTASSYKVSFDPTSRNKSGSKADLRELEAALSGLLNLLSDTQRQLRNRDAELAAAIPIVSVGEDGQHLADRLQGVLRGIADLLNCRGAGLYMLDEATTSLKLRSSYGLDHRSLMKPPRRLEDSAADIEALAGNAIVIDDVSRFDRYRLPEACKAAMCLPIASATTILGTMWMFRDHTGDFSPQDQNMAEIASGRLAADLERSVLTQEVRTLRSRLPLDEAASPPPSGLPKASLAANETAIEEWCQGRLNRLAPFVEDWDLADGYTKLSAAGGFCNWNFASDSRMHLAIGQAHGTTNAELSSVAFKSTHAAHVQHDPSIKKVFEMTNQSLWTSSIEGEEASLLHAVLDPTCGSLEYAICGGVYGYILRPHAWEPLLSSRSPLGIDCECKIEKHRQMLMPGDVFVAVSNPRGVRSPEDTNRANKLAEKLLRNTHMSAADLTEFAAKELKDSEDSNLAVLVAKRGE